MDCHLACKRPTDFGLQESAVNTDDDKERLRCFDNLFGSPPKPQNPLEKPQANWSIDETKSPTDGSPEVIAANLVGDTVLILRCKDQTTEAAFFLDSRPPSPGRRYLHL